MQKFKPVIRWWSFVNCQCMAHFSEVLEVGDDRLIYRRGVFSKSESVIPFSRITNYSVTQNVFDRIFKVANFKVETAGSEDEELSLKGYSCALREILSQAINVRHS